MVAATSTESKPQRRRGRQGKQAEVLKNTASAGGVKGTGGHKAQLITLNETTWYDFCSDTPGRNATITTNPPEKGKSNNPAMILKFKAKADTIMRDEMSLSTTSKDEKWVESTMKKGTLKDRIAAMSVLVSTNPVHKIIALDQLLDLAVSQSNSRVAQLAAEALEDLFLNNLLVPTRKLIAMHQRPLYLYDTATITLSPKVLLLWRFEDLLIEKYATFLHVYLQTTLKDGMELSKLFCLRCASRLLRGAPQGEEVLLSMLVNKLGDPAKKIAAASGHELRRVLDQHGNMQTVVAREVQQLAHRPALSPKALYNCIIFLNQLHLSMHDKELPASLISTYFRLFDVATREQKEGLKGRLLAALLTGVNRAHPFLADADDALNAHMDQLYRLVHTAPSGASTQALLLLFHVAVGSSDSKVDTKTSNDTKTNSRDRFYRALYAKLANITNGKHLTVFFNLLYKAMKYDDNDTRVVVFSKRLLCTCLHASAPILTASLILVSEIMKVHPQLFTCLNQALDVEAVLDATKREPKSALVVFGTDEATSKAGLWEDQLLQHHVHPSVSKFASAMGAIEYQGDPLKDFCLAPFLDKFAYKNPKKNVDKKAESIGERHSEGQKKQLPFNDPSFLKQKQVGVGDEFFKHFFQERARRDTLKGIVRKEGMDDEDDRYKERRRGEDEAFDMAEGFDADHGKILEEGWETDPEEEEFVDQLAEKLMEEHAATTGGAAVDYDDEDPDMEGWDNINDDDVDSHDEEGIVDGVESNGGDDSEGDDDNGGPIHISEMFSDDSDDDNQVEEDDQDSDVGDEVEKATSDIDSDDDAFMDTPGDSDSDEAPDFDGNGDSDDDNVHDFENEGGNPHSDDEVDDETTFFDVEDSEDDDDVEQQPKKKGKQAKPEVLQHKKGKKNKGGIEDVVYADASEYEKILAKAYSKEGSNDGNDHEEQEPPTSTGSGKKRKRRKKKKD